MGNKGFCHRSTGVVALPHVGTSHFVYYRGVVLSPEVKDVYYSRLCSNSTCAAGPGAALFSTLFSMMGFSIQYDGVTNLQSKRCSGHTNVSLE